MNGGIASIFAAAVVGCLGISSVAAGAPPAGQELKSGDYVAVVGDSITEQKMYSVMIEDYLLMCKPAVNLQVTQFGWGGDTAGGFGSRMQNNMLPFHATVATSCFGMNDGRYAPQDPAKAKQYHDAQTSVVEQMKKGGVRFIVVGSPGCVDSETFRHDPALAVMYNKTLASERDIAKQVAAEQGVAFADVHNPMMDVMEKAKAKYGKDYPLAGNDGVHPGPNGHLVMAYAFLKALGCDGNIGTITFDLAAATATATDGHKILAVHKNAIDVESTRYPFCFFGDDLKSPESTAGVLEFLPFNAELNRFTLIVKGAKPNKTYKVYWGKQTREIPGEALLKGVNLAAEFIDSPFRGAFQRVENAIKAQQAYETPLVKTILNDIPTLERALPEEKATIARFGPEAMAKDVPLREEVAKLAAQPVKYDIKVEELK